MLTLSCAPDRSVKQTKLGKAGKGPHTNKKAKKEASASIKALIAEQQKLGSKA